MVRTVEELSKWKVETLRSYLKERGVSLSGSNRKANLIEKVVYAEKLGLRVLPTQTERSSEISANRGSILLVDGAQIPSPKGIKDHWFEGSEYFPDLTLDIVQSYGELSESMKAFKEGKNLQNSGHVKSVLFHRISDTVKFSFIKASVVPQTRISERPYTVWVCLRNDTSLILTGECNCLAGASNSCKHVFALLHFIENEVYLGRNKSCTGKKQQWDMRISKKAEKIHLPCEISSLLIEVIFFHILSSSSFNSRNCFEM